MDPISLKLSRTRARRDFKNRAGTTTQHLLTLIVGLDAVKAGVEARTELPATWNPVSKHDAAMRARTFANQAALLWTVESVVGYVTDLKREKPGILTETIIDRINGLKDKEDKLVALADEFGLAECTALLLVRAAYVWRNRVTHIGAHNKLASDVIRDLLDRKVEIEETYQGLRVSEMIGRIESSEPPRLKESTAISRAAGYLVRDIDAKAVGNVDLTNHIRSMLHSYLQEASGPEQKMQRAVGLWGGTPDANRRSITTFLLQSGLSEGDGDRVRSDLANLSPKGAIKFLES